MFQRWEFKNNKNPVKKQAKNRELVSINKGRNRRENDDKNNLLKISSASRYWDIHTKLIKLKIYQRSNLGSI